MLLLILAAGILLGVQTAYDSYGVAVVLHSIMTLFVLEAVIRLAAAAPHGDSLRSCYPYTRPTQLHCDSLTTAERERDRGI